MEGSYNRFLASFSEHGLDMLEYIVLQVAVVRISEHSVDIMWTRITVIDALLDNDSILVRQ